MCNYNSTHVFTLIFENWPISELSYIWDKTCAHITQHMYHPKLSIISENFENSQNSQKITINDRKER